jgi:hypothetical protein
MSHPIPPHLRTRHPHTAFVSLSLRRVSTVTTQPPQSALPGSPNLNRAAWGVLLLALAWIGFSSTWNLHRSHAQSEYYSDIPFYMGGAQGLASLGRYVDPSTVGRPRVTLYPPLQSAFLAPWFASPGSFDQQLDRAASAMSVLHGLGVLATFFVLRRNAVAPLVSALTAALVATSPQWLTHVAKFMSDPLFAVLAFATALVFFRLPDRPDWKFGVGLGLMGSLLFLTRTAALPISFTIGVWSLVQFRRDWNPRWLIPGIVLSAAVAGWFLFTLGGFNYGQFYSASTSAETGLQASVFRIFRQGFRFVGLAEFSEAHFSALYLWLNGQPRPLPWIASLGAVSLTGLCILGFRSRRCPSDRWSLMALGLYALEVAVWPFPLGARCAMPILPWIAVWGWAGLVDVASRLGHRQMPVIAAASILSLGIATNIRVSLSTARLWHREAAAEDFAVAAAWAREHIPASEPIGTSLCVPRVQLSSMLSRPLVLIWGRIPEPWDKPEGTPRTTASLQPPLWLVRSAHEQLEVPPSTLVFSSGKWRVHRIPAPVPSPSAPAP